MLTLVLGTLSKYFYACIDTVLKITLEFMDTGKSPNNKNKYDVYALSFVNVKYKGVDFNIAYSFLYIYLQFSYYQNSLVFTYIEFKKIV